MQLVIDASVTASWLLPDERHPVALLAYEAPDTNDALVPWIWWFEVRNLLVIVERRGRIDAVKAGRALTVPGRYPVAIDSSPVEADVIDLARRHRLTVYDAAYLELAGRHRVSLATLDMALAAAARAEAIPLLGP